MTPSARPPTAKLFIAELGSALRASRRRLWRRCELPRRALLAIVVAALLVVAGTSAVATRQFARLEDWTLDARFALTPRHPPDPRVLMIVIDDATLASERTPLVEMGDQMGCLLGDVITAGSAAIAFDILPPPSWGQSREFSALIEGHPDVVTLAAAALPSGDVVGPEVLSSLTVAALGSERAGRLFGLVNVQEDADGIVRHATVAHLDEGGAQRLTLVGHAVMSMGVDVPPVSEVFWIDHRADPRAIPRIAWHELASTLQHQPGLFRGRLVLVGGDYAGSGDQYHLPERSVVPGLVIHALIADTLLRGVPLQTVRADYELMGRAIFLLLVASGGLWMEPRRSIGWTVLLCATYLSLVAVGWLSLVVMPIVAPLASLAIAECLSLALRHRLPSRP